MSGHECAMCRLGGQRGGSLWKARLEAGAAQPSGWVLRSLSSAAAWRSHSGKSSRTPSLNRGRCSEAQSKVLAAANRRSQFAPLVQIVAQIVSSSAL